MHYSACARVKRREMMRAHLLSVADVEALTVLHEHSLLCHGRPRCGHTTLTEKERKSARASPKTGSREKAEPQSASSATPGACTASDREGGRRGRTTCTGTPSPEILPAVATSEVAGRTSFAGSPVHISSPSSKVMRNFLHPAHVGTKSRVRGASQNDCDKEGRESNERASSRAHHKRVRHKAALG